MWPSGGQSVSPGSEEGASMGERSDMIRAAVVSIAIHILLGLWMFRMAINVEVEPPAFVEVTLGRLTPQALARILEREAQGRATEAEATPTQRVKLPERRMLEIEEPAISVPKERKLPVTTAADEKPALVSRPRPGAIRETPVPSLDRKETLPEREIAVGMEPGEGVATPRVGSEARPDFNIEGEAAYREILEAPLPEYPPDLQSEATIKIEFTVLPNGTIGSTHPLQKGDTQLENLTLRYFRQWRFEPLGEDQEQRIQGGTITFIYRLQ